MDQSSEITELLVNWCNGNTNALDRLMTLVELELKRIAHGLMRREDNGHILQTTGLVNEAFIKLVDQDRVQWQNRKHFYGIASTIMRRVLLNYHRDLNRVKRGGVAVRVSLSNVDKLASEKSVDIIALEDALNELEILDERKCRVVELRYYGGLSVQETSEALDISTITVMRDWDFARAWLARRLSNGN